MKKTNEATTATVATPVTSETKTIKEVGTCMNLVRFAYNPTKNEVTEQSLPLQVAFSNIKDHETFRRRVEFHYYANKALVLEDSKRLNDARIKLAEYANLSESELSEDIINEKTTLELYVAECQALITAYKSKMPKMNKTQRNDAMTDRFAELIASIHGEAYKGSFDKMELVMKTLADFYAEGYDDSGKETGKQGELRKSIKEMVSIILASNDFGTPEDKVYSKSRLNFNMKDIADLIAVYFKGDVPNRKDGMIENRFAKAPEVKKFIIARACKKYQAKINIINEESAA